MIEVLAGLVLVPLGFAAGAAGTVYWQIIRPARQAIRMSAVSELDRLAHGANAMLTVITENQRRVRYNPAPKDHIPTTIRKSYF